MSRDPYLPPRAPIGAPPESRRVDDGKPGLALGLGIFGLIAWLLPIVGLPVTIIGLVLGGKAMPGRKKGLAIAAVVLCSIGLAFSALNMALGVYLGVTGQHPLVNKMQGK
jgi:hypothetical protein